MAAILTHKNKSKRERNGRFSELKRVSKKKNGFKFETKSLVKVLTKWKVRRDKKTLASHSPDDS